MMQELDSERVPRPAPYVGHSHFWQRVMARRQFVRVGAGASALALGAGMGMSIPALAAPASNSAPNPVPGGTLLGHLLGYPNDNRVFHFFFPAFGNEVATVTEFRGVVAAAEVQGSGIGTDTSNHATSTLYFDADLRFMKGTYVGVDGRPHDRTVGFI